MPAILTHHFFGQDVLTKLAAPQGDERLGQDRASLREVALGPAPLSQVPLNQAEEQAFLLGCQGPDPFFYSFLTPHVAQRSHFGSSLHHGWVTQSLDVLRSATRVMPEDRAAALEAYLRGWLSHLTLDSCAHPYILATMQTLVSAGVPGLGPEAHSEVHGQIESDLDGMLLARRYGLTIRNYRPFREVLQASNQVMDWIGVMFRRVADEVYGFNLPASAYRASVTGMRLSYRALYSPGGRKRSLIGRAERIFRAHSMAQATAHRADIGPECDFDNRDHAPWTSPFTGVISRASFLDIYAQALKLCCQRQQMLTAGATSAELTGGLNFNGEPI